MIDPQSLTGLRERIALAKDFSPDERTLMLDALNIGDYAGRHEYPSRHGPGSSPWTTAAWRLLDQIAPGKLARNDRFLLGGLLAGALNEMFEAGRATAAGRPLDPVEVHAPANTGAIAALYAALSVDAGGEGLCAGPLGDLGTVPLVVAQRKNVAIIAGVARGLVHLIKKPVRIVTFIRGETIEEIAP